ncbi:hypothetical protein CQ017_01485 [Arthrobacter sp. MYb224]|uniref:DUF6504 family protein n=1 Tax=Micrococcaceae TaxID=1268 RepID=UPI000CFA909E|nr:DUF6504 family protein [Arthrobacter sp. MYb224]PRA01206.1 hypothetical protein CQ017_01485 [Arthrobacter sp. MYb224]
MGIFTESIQVSCAPSGVPLRVSWQGCEYRLVAEPQRWFERRKWWDENLRIPRGIGAGLADYEIWRLEITRAAGRGPTRSIDVSFDPQSTRWRLIRVNQELPISA